MRIDVVGRACRLPGANNVGEFWRLLSNRQCSVTRIPEERFAQSWYFNERRGEPGKAYTFAAGVISDVWGFDPGVFSITAREARQMDPQQRLVLQLVWEALEDAAIPASSLSKRNIGVYMGASSMDHSHRQYFDPAGTDSYLMTGNTLSLISNRISYQFDLMGPSLTIDTACSSSLVALDYAVQDLRNGKVDAAIVGGVNGLLSPFNFMGFCAASMLSPDGLCRAFDHRANGYVRSEGGVVMVLQRNGDTFAPGRVHGEILASAMNSDGRTSGVALPSSDQQAELLRKLYAKAGVDPKSLAFVEAHGTGTQVGDPAECFALGKVLGTARRAPLPVGSAKSNVGHLEPASGLVGLLKAQLALEHGVLPATLHVEKLNPYIPFGDLNLKVAIDPIEISKLPAARRRAGVNNFGFGGTNVHVIISPPSGPRAKASAATKKTSARVRSKDDHDGALLFLSAQCRDGLTALATRYVEALEDKSLLPETASVSELANAAAHGRDLLPERLVVAASRRTDLRTALKRFVDGTPGQNVYSGTAVGRSTKSAFVFSGNGAQWSGMGRAALRQSADFRKHFHEIHRAYRAAAGVSLEDLIAAEDLAEKLSLTEIAQPLLFAIQIALAKCLMARGLRPTAVIGHSVGEVAAAHIGGALDLAQAVTVIRARSQHQESVRGLGRMAALQLSDAEARALIADAGVQHVEVAAINSPRSVTVAGDGDEVRHLIKVARERHVAGRLLDIQYPFHSARLDPAREPILGALKGLKPRDTEIPFYSTVAGKVVKGTKLDPSYWWHNVRDPVHFSDAIAAAAKDGCQVFVEISPRSILRNYISDSIATADQETQAVGTFDPSDDESPTDPVSLALGRAIVAGARFDVDAAFGPRTAPAFELPHYPWQNKTFRLAPSLEALDTFGVGHFHPLLGTRLRYEDAEWDRQLDTGVVPYLADHKVGDRAIMPGTGYVEMALAAATQQLRTQHIELRDIDFVQALELSAGVCQDVRTRIDQESSTVVIASRTRLSGDERQTHMRTRFARTPSDQRPHLQAPIRKSSATAPPHDEIYRIAAHFHLNYGPAFSRVTTCREIGDDVIEVELSTGAEETDAYILHPVDFDACLHGLNVIYKRLQFGENRLSFVPVRIGSLRVFEPGVRIGTARIRVGRYSTRGAVADFELFAHDGTCVALANEVRLKAASLVHRLKLDQAAYQVRGAFHALPAESMRGPAISLAAVHRDLMRSSPLLDEAASTSLKENLLLVDLAAKRVAYDRAQQSEVTDTFDASLMHVLEIAGLAEQTDGEWQIDPDCLLPPVDEIVAGILADDPSWSAECIMLLNAAGSLLQKSVGNETALALVDHSTATIEHFQSGAPQTRAQIAAVVRVVATVLHQRSPLRPLRILQLGAGCAELTRELVALLSDGRIRLVVADSDPQRVGRLASQWPGVPGLTVVTIDDELSQLRPLAHFDLVVSVNGLSWLTEADSILSRLRYLLSDGALAVISERQPDTFHSVVFGREANGTRESESGVFLRDGEAWQQLIARVGFGGVKDAGDGLSVPGVSLVIAKHAPILAAERTSIVTDDEAEIPNRHPVVVIGRVSRSDKGFESKLADALAGAGLEAVLTTPASSAKGNGVAPKKIATKDSSSNRIGDHVARQWNAVVRELGSDAPGKIDIIFSLDAAPSKNGADMRDLLARTYDLTAFLQVMGDRTARVWIIAEGGARALAGLGAPCPVQTGVWAYGRTAINEFGKLDIRLVDFMEGMSPDAKAERLALLLSDPGSLRELVLTAESVVGLEVSRGAPEVAVKIAEQAQIGDYDGVVLQQREQGNLDNLTWVRSTRRAPLVHEVEIEVAASGLNFRDVMWVMGLLPEEALEDGFAGPTIGLECAGRVVRVGRDVAGLAPGDRVIAIAPASFASHVTVSARAVARLPSGVGLREAASIPVPFLTACYGLEYLAKLRKDEWVLIHGAAGGVGLAAIQVAKRNGARVIATAGSDEKRTFLYRLGADHVLDTRSLDFVDQVRDIAPGGINVVLNSLAGEAMERSIELLRPFGRFIELGKRDFYASTKVSLRPFRDNISYFGVDADQLLTYEPDVAQQVLGSVIAGFENGSFSPLPCRIFDSGEVVDAFRLMQKSGHIGKIIVDAPPVSRARTAEAAEFVARENRYHVVFGGTGGFGLEYARWLASRGARHIVIASRSGGVSEDIRVLVDTLKARGVSLESMACDVTNKRAVASLLDRLRKKRPIAGIAHTAMVLDDGLIKSLTTERIEKVLAPKVVGARNLDQLTRDDELDYFILFSSAAAMFGNPGQASYVAANGFLDGLARERRARGQKAIAVAWGAITDVGILTRDKDAAKSLSRHTGGVQFTARDGLDLLAQILVREAQGEEIPNITLAAMNWAVAKDLLPIMASPAYESIRREAATRTDGGATGVDLQSAVRGLDEAGAKKAVADYLVKEVAAIFRMPPDDINPKRSLTDIGMDSLMGLELRMAVERQIGIDIMKVSMSDGTTINDIAGHIAGKLRNSSADDDEVPSEQTVMISQHVTEEIDVNQLRQLGEKVARREADMQRVVS